jgi:hypothetical protein
MVKKLSKSGPKVVQKWDLRKFMKNETKPLKKEVPKPQTKMYFVEKVNKPTMKWMILRGLRRF